LTNKLSEEVLNQLLLQVTGKKLLNSINIIHADLKKRFEKCIVLDNAEYSHAFLTAGELCG
tara:strand:- start:1795 stop:1977 length:183 start_codon:yes stop_codon:yes gene_type:complete